MSVNLRLIKLICAGMFATLGACGGAPGTNPNLGGGSGSGGSGNATTRDITVTVSGTASTVVINVGTQQLTFDGEGQTVLEDVPFDPEVEATFVSSPAGENCVFMPSSQIELEVIDAVDVQCGVSSVRGWVRNYQTDAPIPSVTIDVTREGSGYATVETFTGDAEGNYAIENLVINERTVLTLKAEGYANYSAIVYPNTYKPHVIRNVQLVPYTEDWTLPPTEDMQFVLAGVPILSVPANGFQNGSGGAPVGDVTAEMTLLDGSADPDILPGDYEAFAGGYLETIGAIGLLVKDSLGTPLELAAGVEANVVVPLNGLENAVYTSGGTAFPSDDYPGAMYSYDAAEGVWQAESNATLPVIYGVTRGFSVNVNTLAESYTVAREFSGATFVSGCFVDNQGNQVAGIRAVAEGQDYAGLTTVLSDQNGNFLLPVKPNSTVLVYGLLNTRSQTIEAELPTDLSLILNDCNAIDNSTSTITLTWGEDPADLDSQLFGPDPSDNSRFRIYFSNKVVTVNGVTMFLDVDDVTSFGPEVTTLPSFPSAGTYEFMVDLYAGESTIRNSPARVEVNVQGDQRTFSPGGGTETECWHVFDIQVDDNLRGTIVPRNNWVSDTACTNGLQ